MAPRLSFALVVCFFTDAELTSEPVKGFEELGLNVFGTGMNQMCQCSGHATSGCIGCACSCAAALIQLIMCRTEASPRTPLELESKLKKEPGVDSCWHVAALGFLTTFFVTITVSNSSFFYLGFIQEYGVTREAATWPSSVISVLSHLSGLPLAALQRRVSLYKIFLLGGLLSWVGVVASAFVPTIAWMAVTLGAIHGLGIGIIAIALSILLSLYFDKYRCLTQGIKYAGASCAGLIFPKFFAYLQQEYDFRGTLLIYGGITMHVSVLCLLLKEPSWIRLKTSQETTGNTNEELSTVIHTISVNCNKPEKASTTSETTKVKERYPTLKLFLNPMLYVVLTVAVVTDFTGAAYLSTLVDYAVDKGLSIEDAESLVIYGSCSEFVGRLFLPLMADAGCMRRTTLVTVSFFVWGCSMMLMPYATIHVHIIIVCSCVYLASGCLQPMRSVLIVDYIGVQWLSTCYTFSGFIVLPLIFCNPSIIGFFRDARGSYDGLYRLYGGMHLLVSLLFLAVVCIERRHSAIWTLSEKTQEKNWWFFRDFGQCYDNLYRMYGVILRFLFGIFLGLVCVERGHNDVWAPR